jgi:hypothetical protein
MVISLRIIKSVALAKGPVAQLGWSVRLITERSPVRIRLGPLQNFKFSVSYFEEDSF